MVNPEMTDLKAQVSTLNAELAAVKAEVAQMRDAAKSASRQSFLQLIGVVGTAAAIVIATLLPRIEAVERRAELTDQNINRRFEDFQKAQDKRFDDFKQELRAMLAQPRR